MRYRVLYAVVCGSPAARDVGTLVALAQAQGWDVCVVATPDAMKFIDVTRLAEQTGHPVRHQYKWPGEPDVLPVPDAFIVAPATVNTINKWAAGIADTLALGLIVEGIGAGLPIVAVPFTNAVMAAHPAFAVSIANLRSWGVSVLHGDDVIPPFAPGTGERYLHLFPWHRALETLEQRIEVPTAEPTSPAVE
jgi:phosphopantothenoylcysteine synthetase/decarboxylase